MKTLKHIGGILLATVGVMFVLGAITAAFDRDPEMLWWMVAIMFVVLGLLPLAGAVVLLRRRATELPSAHCPQCGGTERAPAGVLTRSHNPWLYHFGGWLFASL